MAQQNDADSAVRLRSALKLVWKVAVNPIALFDHVDYSATRKMETDEGRFQSVYYDAREKLNPDADYREDAFDALRSKFSEPDVLRSYYEVSKQTMLATVVKAAVKGTAVNLLKAGLPVFGKPLTLTAASAGDWFGKNCYRPEEEQYSYAQDCKTSKFPKLFKDDYGVEANRSNVYVLAWLYRRHLEGGPKLAAEWQRIGLDLAMSYEITQAIEVSAPLR